MREIPYHTFSQKTHQKNWLSQKPNFCQFELTFGCGLHCRHCYTDCYNSPKYIKNELSTKQVKYILDEIYNAGIIWLCFSGGDPLSRKDFLDIYAYAKDKGFIITVFTNGYSMTREIASYFKKRPPFVIELTLNAVSEELSQEISQKKNSWQKILKGINIILKAKLPLKIKTEVTKDNLKELPQIKKFIRGLGLIFRFSFFLHARLDGDRTPCILRIAPEEAWYLSAKKSLLDNGHGLSSTATHSRLKLARFASKINLFRCTAGVGDGIHLDPYGNIFPCFCIREPKVSLLRENVIKGQKRILNWVRTRYFTDNAKCKICSIRQACLNCPGKALLEKGNLQGSIDWFCKLAHLRTRLPKQNVRS